jgi:hypothetical protein
VSVAAIAIATFFALVVLPRATLPMADGDAWWHIHAGEEILATGRVPNTNAWTIAAGGEPWVSQDWLSNMLMAVLFNYGDWGLAWLSLAFALMTVAGFAVLWRAAGVRGADWLGRLLWLTLGLIVAGPIIGIRVQTVDLLMTAATVFVLWAHVANPRPWRPFLLVLIIVVWVNLHAGWVMLFLLGGAVVVGELIDRWLRRDLGREPITLPAVGWLGGALAASAAALVLNPNGSAIYAYPFSTASIAAHRDFLIEWSPPDPTRFEGQVAIAFLVLAALPTIALRARRMPTADLLWLAGLSILTMAAVRFALFLGPVGAAIAAVHLSPVVARSRLGQAVLPTLKRWRLPPRSRTQRSVNAMLMVGVIVLGAGLAVARAAPASQARAIAQSVPMEAAAWVEENAPGARIFNTYSWGGYLARRLPDAKVYIDGRSDIYGNDPIQRFAATWNITSDPAQLLDSERIDLVLVRPSAPLVGWLADRAGWKRTYEDVHAVIWIRSEG